MSCCAPWGQCQSCGEDVPIYILEDVDGRMICRKCLEEWDKILEDE
jgi:formylmethanofuran dehydrogenase subunit E